MNKSIVDKMLPAAYKALNNNSEIVNNGEINKTYRGQISTFGAAINSGSLLSAIAFFSNQGSSGVHREELLKCIEEILREINAVPQIGEEESLFQYVRNNAENEALCKENIINASIALKLVMNLYSLK